MIKRDQPFFQCEYCRAVYIREKVCAYHEKVCRKNPNNKHICIGSANGYTCDHLKVYERGEDDGISKSFYCRKHDKYMYTFKAERRGDFNEKIRTMQCDGNRMPIVCEDYLSKSKEDWDNRKDGEFPPF